MTQSDILTHGSLFSGYGGLDLAISEVFGTTTAWVSDIDKGANKVLAHRFPDASNLGDISQVDWSTVEPVGVLSGGFPCQDLSGAGKQAGMKRGTRSGLWFEFHRAIQALRPSLVVIENVRGLLSGTTGDSEEVVRVGPRGGRTVERTRRALGRVLSDLAEIGYDARWYGLRAADVGAPHGRFRVFIVAYPRGEHGIERWLAAPGEAEGGRALGELAGRDRAPVALLPTPTAQDGKNNGGPSQHERKSPPTNALIAARPEHWGKYADAITRWERLTREVPAPTEPGRNDRPRLSPRFTEWMMGLPAGWITDVPGVTRNEALRLCGNGVVPQQARYALGAMLQSFDILTKDTEDSESRQVA